MAVNGAIAAEEQDHIGLIGSRRYPDAPVNARINLKGGEILPRAS
jgi:hypothetical protein